ncbi:MAG: M67 family metallopeptidase [Methylococcales bacterium]|nr:M67 family metallopeptidase [Methylococcales bacterium]
MKNIKEIQLSRKITTQLLHLAQISPDKEICGLIGSVDGRASTCYPITNTAQQPEIQFQLDEKQQINAMSAMRDRYEQLFAIYHSHPTAPASPSATDIKLSAYPAAINLIISLNTKGMLEIKGYKIKQQSVEELYLSLLND